MFARRLFSGYIAAAVTLALAGCGGDSSSTAGKQSPTGIVAASQQAAQHYMSVLASGLVPDTGGRVRVDVQIAHGKGAVGSIADAPYNLEVIRIGQNIYLRSGYSLTFYERIAGRKAATHLLGRWIHASVDAGSLIRRLSSFTELSNLTRGFFGQPGRLSIGGMANVVGINVVEVKNNATNEVLYVATAGTPYPAQILQSGASTDDGIAFDQWNRPVPISAPPNAIDIEKISRKA